MGRDESGVVAGGRHDQVLVGVARERGLRHVSQAADQGVRENEDNIQMYIHILLEVLEVYVFSVFNDFFF